MCNQCVCAPGLAGMRQPRHGARPPDTPRGLPLPLLLALQAVLRCRRCCAGTERSVGRVRLSRAQRPLRKCMVITGRTDGRTPDNLRVATSAKNFLSKFCAPGTDNFRVATSATHFFEIRATGTVCTEVECDEWLPDTGHSFLRPQPPLLISSKFVLRGPDTTVF